MHLRGASFFYPLLMIYKLRVPARINILGNPSDANEGDFATISAAVDIYAHAKIEEIKPAGHIILEQLKITQNGLEPTHKLELTIQDFPLPYTGKLDLVKGAVNRLFKYSNEFREKIHAQGFKLSTWTEVPRQSGLGGSSLFVILALSGLRALYKLDSCSHNDYILAELTQRVEAKELNITAGYADRYVPLFGGIAYLDYRGKLHQKSIHDEPYTTYEKLDPWVDDLPLLTISSGLVRDSGDVHGKMRPKYLQEYDLWVSNGGEIPPMVKFMRSAWETAWRGKIALLHKDWASFGGLMNQNHAAVDRMMTYCGFVDGAGWANNLLIKTALENGAYGAKLTGAGSGGSVFAITKPDSMDVLRASWESAANQSGLDNAQIYQPRISRRGLVIESIS
jgi:galactokinase/mevalonate kinase-like predicted kinase